MASDDTEEDVNDDEVANDDAAGGGAEGGVDRVADAEEHDDDVDGDGDLDIDDEASDDDSPVEELIKCIPPDGYELVRDCPKVVDGALEGQHILIKWPEEDGGWVHAIVEKPYRRKNNAGKNYNVKSTLKRLWATPTF